MARALLLLSLAGILAGGVLVAVGLSDGEDGFVLAGALLIAVDLPWLVSALSLSGHADTARRAALDPARATIRRAWQTGPWVNEKPAIGLELAVEADGSSRVLSTKERLPNFHLQVGQLQPGVELPVLVEPSGDRVEVDWDRWERERGAGAIEPEAGARDEILPKAEPPIGAHVVDGILRPLRPRRLAVAALLAAVPLAGGLLLWADDAGWVGVVLASVGALLGSFIVSSVVTSRRTGITLADRPEAGWPAQVGVGEVLETWWIGSLGYERVCGFVLRVHVEGRQWEVKIRQAVPEAWVPRIAPGLKVAVRGDPHALHRVAIDWPASG